MDLSDDFGKAGEFADRFERAGRELIAVLRRPETAERLRNAPGEAQWSALETLGHVVEMIPYWLSHCRTLIAAEGEPPAFGRTLESPERLEAVETVEKVGPDTLMDRLETEVESAVGEIRGMSAADLEKKGMHVRRGEMAVAEVLERFIVAHLEEHVEQVRAAGTLPPS